MIPQAATATETTVFQTLSPYEAIETWPPGKTLFREGDPPDGVFLLHDGETDLMYASRSGDEKALLVAEPGQLLGLSALVGGRGNDSSAITRTPAVTGFVDKQRFLALLDENPELWFSVLRMISSDINACWDCMRTLGAVAR